FPATYASQRARRQRASRPPAERPDAPCSRGPRPRAAGVRTPSPRPGDTSTGQRPVVRAAARRPRFTGRAAVLVLVLAVLTVSYASSLRAYLQQRSHIGDLKAQIAERETSIDALEREKRRWDDPAYVKAQARARFGYLMPGESGFEVIGPDGKPLEAQASLNDPDEVIRTVPKAWWSAAWESMELAGDPPPPEQQPADLIDGTKTQQ
ncbi:MAG: FtsB family cell division protein, partial [Terrabacter sp.]